MTARRILLETACGLTRAALMQGNTGLAIGLDAPEAPGDYGGVYVGRVRDLLTGMQAAYLDIGTPQAAYLPLNGLDRAQWPRSGQLVTVTVAAQPDEPHKGMRVQLGIQCAGRYMVYLAQNGRVTASRRLDETTRQELLATLQPAVQPGEGVVVRTAAAGVPADLLLAELHRLRQRAGQIARQAAEGRVGLVWRPDAAEAFLATYARPGDAVLCTDAHTLQSAEQLLAGWGMPNTAQAAPADSFYTFGADRAWLQALQPEMPLSGGQNLTFTRTRAAWLVDVDSGHYAGRQGQQQAAEVVNRLAVQAALQQLAVRNCTGAILIDLLAVQSPEARAGLVDQARQLAAQDAVATQVHGMTKLGFLEISRLRTVPSLAARCQADAAGQPAPWLLAAMLLRRAQALRQAGGRAEVCAPQPVWQALAQRLGQQPVENTLDDRQLLWVPAQHCSVRPIVKA